MTLYKEIGSYYLPGDISQRFTHVSSLQELELLLADGKIIECLTSISGEILRFPWKISTNNQKLADTCTTVIGQKGILMLALEIARALIMGLSAHEIVWRKYPDGLILPSDIILRESSIIRYKYLNNKMTTWIDIPGKTLSKAGPRKWMISKFWSIPNTDPYGNGLGEALAPFVDVRSQGLLDMSRVSSDGAEPVRIGYYPVTASDSEIMEFDKLVKDFGRAKSVTIPEGFTIETQTKISDNGHKVSLDLFEQANREISMIILGEATAGQATSNGSYSKDSISLSLRVTRSIMLAKLIEHTLNTTLLPWIRDLNYPGADNPVLEFTFPGLDSEDSEDSEDKE